MGPFWYMIELGKEGTMFKGSSTAAQLMALKAEGLTNIDIVDLLRSVDPDARASAVKKLAQGPA